MHNHIAFVRKNYQFNLAHKLCDLANTIFLEDIDFRTMAKGFLGKHTVDALVSVSFDKYSNMWAKIEAHTILRLAVSVGSSHGKIFPLYRYPSITSGIGF